jgi:F0F1-type ATP synthase assembly protein I
VPAPFVTNDISGAGVRLVMRVVRLQLGCAATVGMLFLALQGWAAGCAGFSGGLIAAVGSGLFGWRFFAPGVAPAAVLQRALFAAESLKWLWYLVAVWAALARFKLAPLPLMTGLVVAQFGYWLGLAGTRGRSNGSV